MIRTLSCSLILLVIGLNASCKDYLDYHRYINKAETYLVSDVSDSTFYYYDKAFAEYASVFARDAFVAAQYSWKRKNKDRTIRYLIKGSYSGLRSSCIDQAIILNDFINSPFYDAVYDSMKNGNLQYSLSIDQDLRSEWKIRDGELGVTKDEADFIDVVERNASRVKELLRAKKYPAAAVMGLSDYCVEMENYYAYKSLANYDCVIAELYDGLWEAVKKGQLHPRDFAALWEKEQIWLKAEAHAKVAGGSNRITNRKCPDMKPVIRHFKIIPSLWEFTDVDIDKDRALYYICSIETDRKKKQLETDQGYILFFGPQADNGIVEFH